MKIVLPAQLNIVQKSLSRLVASFAVRLAVASSERPTHRCGLRSRGDFRHRACGRAGSRSTSPRMHFRRA